MGVNKKYSHYLWRTMTYKILLKKSKKLSEFHAEFHADFKSFEIVLKNAHKKVIGKTSLTK